MRTLGGLLEVATTTAPLANMDSNSALRIMASAMSVTWNSSKHSTHASAIRSRTTRSINTFPPPCPAPPRCNAANDMPPAVFPLPWLSWRCFSRCSRWWMSIMKLLKCTRRFRCMGSDSKNTSIRNVLPHPVPPHMYSPRMPVRAD